jgi:hypothetical protein
MTSEGGEGSGLRCQWCDTVSAVPKAIVCANCGAALILRESIEGIGIPGVTEVDPDLALYAKKPLRIPRGSPSEAVAGPAIAAAALGGPAGLVALGALGAVVAKEYSAAGGGSKVPATARLGEPSAPIVEIVNKLNAEAAAAADQPTAETTTDTDPPSTDKA